MFYTTYPKVEEITGLKYTSNEVKEISEEQNKTNIAIRVIVDHVRAVASAIDTAFQYRSRICDSAYFTSCNTLRIYF
jgi:alanyl-tRNA synthetase